jgi:predicted RNA-binding protein with PUA-like domain
MQYWLIKSEPSEYSWDMFVKEKKAVWTGIRSYAARNNLKAMQKGDLAFFYHSNEGKDIVGIAKVAKEFYQDPTTDEEAWVVVDFVPEKKLKNSVTLVDIKNNKKLAGMELLKIGRLSVSKVIEKEFEEILKMSEKTKESKNEKTKK